MHVGYLTASYELFLFFFRQIPFFRSLPSTLRTPYEIDGWQEIRKPEFIITVARQPVQRYNDAMKTLRARIRELNPRNAMGFQLRMFLLFAVRFLTIFLAFWFGEFKWIVAATALQFLIAPYSIYVGISMLVVLAAPLYAPHYLINVILNTLLDNGAKLFPTSLATIDTLARLSITPLFIVTFFAIDQLINIIFAFRVPFRNTRAKPFGIREHLVHAIYGNLNCKTFALVVLLYTWRQGFQLRVLTWLIDFVFGLSERASRVISRWFLHWSPLFYHQHRLAHMPLVYEHAHKFHHFLQGTNAFDAHVYGSGMPEEWLCLLVELMLATSYGLTPLTLNYESLHQSWLNKIGHTRKLGDNEDNHHADHHAYHSNNFSIYGAVLDLVFETNSNNTKIELNGYRMIRSQSDKEITITYELIQRTL